MKHTDQIKQLLDSQTGPNNCLALQLMQSLWKYSFEEALLAIKWKKGSLGKYSIDLLDLKILYVHDHNIILDYIYIRRTIHYKEELLEEQSKCIYEGDPSDQRNLFKDLNDNEYKAILEDLKIISPVIEALFKV